MSDTVTRADAAGNDRAAAYARCALAAVRWLGDPEANVAAAKETGERALALFEAEGDDRGQALAWTTRAYAHWFEEHVEDARMAAERGIVHALTAGDRGMEGDLLGLIAACSALGPTPIADGIAETERILADARAKGNRRLEQSVLRSIGTMYTMEGAFDRARGLIDASRALAQELGLTIEYWAAAQNAGRNEWFAGDLDAAADVLRESCDALDALGETAFLSTHATMLAELEIERGFPAEADRWIEVAERTGSPDDRATQIGIQQARGAALEAAGDSSAGDHYRRAVELGDETDMSPLRIDARLRLARWLSARHPDEAMRVAREALDLADAKGAVERAGQVRRFLSERED